MERNLSHLSKYRTQLMGIAILLIMFYHSYLPHDYPSLIGIIHLYAYCGVEIFMFLSGIGIFFAYQKENAINFIKKRLLRILPYYIPIALLFSILFIYLGKDSFSDNLLPDITFFNFLRGRNLLGWYIPGILFFYLITPLLFHLKNSKLLIAIIYILTCIAINSITQINHLEILFYRLPAYVIGLYFGYLIAENKKISINWLIGATILGSTILICNYTLANELEFIPLYLRFRIPFSILVAPICLSLANLFSLLKNYDYPILAFLGTYTLALYTFHERILILLGTSFNTEQVNTIAFILAIILAYFWQKFMFYFLKKLKVT